MADPTSTDPSWDYTDKVVEILGNQNVDEETKQRLLALFEDIGTDINAHIQKRLEELLEENEKIEEEEEEEEDEGDEEEETAEEIERRAEKARKKALFEAATIAVDHLRAIRQTIAPIRHNKWRKPNAQLTAKNINIRGLIAEGGFASVYLIENTETKLQYAMKCQGLRVGDDVPMRTPPEDTGAPTPPITPSSEHTKISEKEMTERHLLTKRFNETKCYLQYIRSGHPFICNLEAFFDLRGGGRIIGVDEDLAYAHIFEYCDWGTLDNLVCQYYETPRWGARRPGVRLPQRPSGMPEVYKHAAIPEAFIWHVYVQSMEALAFLHSDHELNQAKEFHRHNQVIVIDIKLDNILLKSSGKPNTYPDIKLADFGEATYVAYGQTRWKDYGTGILKPPEEPWMNAKYDVWCMGIVLHTMSHSGREATRPEVPKGKVDLSVEPQWSRFDPHLSLELCTELRRPREMDVEKRWTAYQIWQHIKPMAEARIPLMYRPLQPWAKPEIDIEFEKEYLEWVEKGGELSESEEIEENDDEDGSDEGGDDKGEGDDHPIPPGTPKPKNEQQTQPESPLKRQREEERGKENLPPVRPLKRRLMRYRKLRAYRI
ncbi:hypothetical protein NHQ30_006847 [Ciborinia camelliae]|nr:hypothetical protein NHQ30_006847 [Ciborinia camelliae]